MKLWGNLSFNPISVLTGDTLEGMATSADGRLVAGRMMTEAQAIGAALGIGFSMDVAERMDRAARVGPHKTSMLQDFEAGRALELEALLGVVIELGDLLDLPCDTLKAVYHLVRLKVATAAA